MRKRWHPPTLLGPLFGYDLVASTRRGQHNGLRVLIASGLLVVLFLVYRTYTRDFGFLFEPFRPSRPLVPTELAGFATTFAAWCLMAQFAAVLLLTPAVVADAIAREKERRSLDFLLVTDLTSREIILGKLGARLAYLVGVLLTGLPILALTQLFGGVDPVLLYGGYAALFATLFSLGALSMFCSVSSQTALQATVRAYVAAAILLGLCGFLLTAIFGGETLFGVLAYVGINLAFAALCLTFCVHELRPWSGTLQARPVSFTPAPAPVAPPSSPSRPPTPISPQERTGAYVAAMALLIACGCLLSQIFEVDTSLVAVLFVAVCVLIVLRALEPGTRPTPAVPSRRPDPVPPGDGKPAVRGWAPAEPWRPNPLQTWEPKPVPRAPLPPVSDEAPLLWKEVHLHSLTGRQAEVTATLFVVFLAIGVSVAALFLLAELFNPQGDVTAASNLLVRIGTVVLGGLLGLGALVHTTNSVTRERERDTLDGLLTLPVERAKVLEAKWLGGLVSLDLLMGALTTVWLFGLLTGGVHPLALARLVLAVAAPVEFLASLGLLLSVVCRTSLRANMAAALCLLLVASGPWIVANYVEMFAPSSVAMQFEVGGVVIEALTPPLAWVNLCVNWTDYQKLPPLRADYLLAGALVYAVAAGLLWYIALVRFRGGMGK